MGIGIPPSGTGYEDPGLLPEDRAQGRTLQGRRFQDSFYPGRRHVREEREQHGGELRCAAEVGEGQRTYAAEYRLRYGAPDPSRRIPVSRPNVCEVAGPVE